MLSKLSLDINDVVDEHIITNGWLLYGCAKPGLQPYKITKILTSDCIDISNSLSLKTKDLVETLLSITQMILNLLKIIQKHLIYLLSIQLVVQVKIKTGKETGF